MKKAILLFSFVIRYTASVFAQTEYLVTVNPTTGSFTLIDSIPGVKWIHAPSQTFDIANQRYIFQGADSSFNWYLYTLDAATGAIISNPPFPVLVNPNDNIVDWQYSNSLNQMFGLHWNNSQGKEYLVSINPATGSFTIINSLPGVVSINGFATFDDVNHRYIFRGGDVNNVFYLYAVDAVTGNILSNPPFPVFTDPNDNIAEWLYGSSTNQMYGLIWDNSMSTEYLASIDLATGAFTNISSLPGIAWIGGGFTTFDNFNDRLIFQGGDTNGIGYLYAVDVITGIIISNPVFSLFFGNDNITMPAVVNSSGTLDALHWESVTTGIKENESPDHICSFFPNPVTKNAEIVLDKSYKEILIFVYDVSGQVVKKLNTVNAQEINISRDNLSNGQYLISVIGDHICIGTIKMTIQ